MIYSTTGNRLMAADQNQQSRTYGSSSSNITGIMEQEQQGQEQAVKYKGVRKRKWGKWVSEIRLPNSRERIWLGSYDSPEKAARAFDAALYCLRGPGARFNFPDNPPDIVIDGALLTPQDIQLVATRYANQINTTHSAPHHVPTEDGQQQQQDQTLLFSARDGNDKGNCSNTTSTTDEDIPVGPAVITTTTTTTTAAIHETPIDWSFLGMLDSQSHHHPPQTPGEVSAAAAAAAAASDRHFELFSGMDNMSMSMDMNMGGGDYYHDTNHMDFDSNHNHYLHHDQMAGDDQAYSYHSFLWNF